MLSVCTSLEGSRLVLKLNRLKDDLSEAMKGFKTVDHHDHLGSVLFKKPLGEIDLPFFFARGYVRSDLVSSGLPQSFYKPSNGKGIWEFENFSYLLEGKDESERVWSQLKPYLEKVRNTTYYQYLLIALRDLYGFDSEEFGDDWKELSDKIRANSKRNPDYTLNLLETAGIHKVILDVSGTGPPSTNVVENQLLVHVVRMDGFILGNMKAIEGFWGNDPIRSLDEYLGVLDEAFETVVKAGAVGIKSGLAYQRIIEYREVPKHKAEEVLTNGLENASSEGRRVFQDFMMHEVCKRCGEHKLPFQIHTGIQAGNYNTIGNADPTYLTNLLRKYPDVKFDIFHGGYPYCKEAGLLAKYFPNAYIDGCWLTHISPSTYKDALDEWLEIVPATKVFAWGGDHVFAEHTYASLKLARELISEVLAAKVIEGRFSMKTALWVGERIMGENAIEVYGL